MTTTGKCIPSVLELPAAAFDSSLRDIEERPEKVDEIWAELSHVNQELALSILRSSAMFKASGEIPDPAALKTTIALLGAIVKQETASSLEDQLNQPSDVDGEVVYVEFPQFSDEPENDQ